MPLELTYILIYSVASATSLVNLFHMFIPLCVKQGCTSSLYPWGLLFSADGPSCPALHMRPAFCSSEQKSSSEMVQGDERDVPALCQP